MQQEAKGGNNRMIAGSLLESSTHAFTSLCSSAPSHLHNYAAESPEVLH